MPKTHTQWTDEDTKLLIDNYQTASVADISKLLPTKTYIAIERRAHKLGMVKTCPRTRVGNLERLLEDTPEAYYWIGLLLADGHLNHSGRLQLNLNDKDLIEAFAKYINYTGTRQDITHANPNHKMTYCVTIYSKQVVNQIKAKFNIATVKTLTPPDLQSLNIPKDLMTAIIIGYIDGDGCIRPEGHAEMNCHSSWMLEYDYISKFLKTKHSVKLDHRGQAYLCISVSIMQDLKAFAIKYNLPILKRKWDRVF